MSEWFLDSNIQAELSNEWFDKPEIVAELQLNTTDTKPKKYERLEEAKRLYPYLQDKDFDYVENLTDDKKKGYLEFWEPGDEGPPDGSVKRPEGIALDRMGIEVRNPETRPIDILGDYASHEGIYSDPKLKDIYDRYIATLTDKQLRIKYEGEKKNYGEDRPFEQWAERSGKPGMFRGYTFDQFSEEEINEAYTDEQKNILDEAKKYLGVKKLNYKGKDVTEKIKINRSNQIKNYFTEQGYSKEAVSGILGNIAVESADTFDSTIKQRKGGKAIGIYQMEPPMRKAYEGWLEKNNLEDSGISQSKYIHALIQGTDNSHPEDGGPYLGKGKSETIRKLLSNAKTPEEAAIAFQDYIEKPGTPHTDKRIKKANEYYESD